MRRKDREIVNHEELLKIIRKCVCCNLSLFDEEYPYVVPLSFGVMYEQEKFTLYFHGAKVGKKIDLLKQNSKAGFSMNCSNKVHLGEIPCKSTTEYESICGNGTLTLVEDMQEKQNALSYLMKQYQPEAEHHFSEQMANSVAVLKLDVHEITGKRLML